MTLTRRGTSQYRIDTLGFARTVFTTGSIAYLSLPAALQFAAEQKSVLQSAAEAVAFRIAANGTMDANSYQTTRTTAIYHKAGGEFRVAFDDSPNPATNILLARPQGGYDAHNSTGHWLVNRRDPLIRVALARAARAGRIVPV